MSSKAVDKLEKMYQLKPGKIGNKVISGYKKIEEKFTDTFLEKDETSPSGYTLKTGRTGQKVTGVYQKIENGVVGSYKKVENGVVGAYKKIENGFVDAFWEEKN